MVRRPLLCAWAAALLVVLAAAVPAAAQSRGKIAGRVTDAATGEALPGVNVVIVGTTLGTATDLDGEYFIANLQVGTYDVRATYLGYDALTVTGVNVNPNATATVNFALEEATLEVGGEVVVEAQRPLVERDNTASTTRIESEEISYRPTAELTQVLTTIPSINVENGEVTVRGRTLDEVAFVVDGARARNPLNHDPYTRVNLSAIQELEVITGGFNAEYGEAQSGVINVITKEGSENYEVYLDARYTPPGQRHFRTAFYDRSSPLFWENTHAMHLEWWIENTDQWTDPNGVLGSDPRSEWTPEEAYEHYLATHRPLTDYTDTPTYQTEVGLGGPIYGGATFYGTLRYRSEAPLFGNAYRDHGEYLDGNLKVALPLGGGMKLLASGFFGEEEAGWGFFNDYFWASTFGARGRYAFYDFAGLSYDQTNGQSLQFAHVLSASTLYELRLSRVQAIREVNPFPDDPLGFAANGPTPSPILSDDPDGDSGDPVGFNTTGYFFRFADDNTEWAFEGDLSSQLNKYLAVKTGAEFSYYVLDHFNQAKDPGGFRTDDRVYHPYQGAAYAQGKVEYGGLIVNAGLRLDVYNANDTLYVNVFDPFGEDSPRERTKLYAQLSPRIGVSHPIDTRTVFHFSYGHFFQRPPFNDYGEQIGEAGGSLNTVVNEDDPTVVYVLGNRNLRPQHTTAYEVGIERNFWDFFIFDLTGYYKDIRNTIRAITVQTEEGGTYLTTGNGDYADERGVEVGLRKVPSTYSWGTISGYANFTASLSIFGRSGDPVLITPDGPGFALSGDFIGHRNPRLKLGLYYQTPTDWEGPLGAVLGGLSLALDYRASFPNDQLRQDFIIFEGQKHLRPVDQVTDLRLRKEIALPGGMGRLSPYLEVTNLFNDRWVFIQAAENVSPEDQRAFIESGFEDLPERDNAGNAILDVGFYRNLPRSVVFGVTFDF
ncbi:MAG TPA: TonB-dependent receptor [Rubricoccaceae bacterium]|nr:TonB-dependent receptor [Rubricoccaceae bacterium]